MIKQITSTLPVYRGGAISTTPATNKDPAASFVKVLKDFLRDVNRSQLDADRSIKELAAGQVADVHQVMIAVEKANITLDLLIEIRNKLLEAYQQLMKIPL